MSAPSQPLEAALTDPRLKLFQLNYDTYTREHLSAIVDSIPITPSRSGSADVEIRHSKKIRLSPPEDLTLEEVRPPLLRTERRDYLGESKSLMSAIRQHTRSVSLEPTESERSLATVYTVHRKVSHGQFFIPLADLPLPTQNKSRYYCYSCRAIPSSHAPVAS